MATPTRTASERTARRRRTPATPVRDDSASDRTQRAIQRTMNSSEVIAVGILNLVRSTLVTALAGVKDVGAELGSAAVTAVRGSIRAAQEIGGDLGLVVREAIRGTITAAEQIGGDLGGTARSAARGAVKATSDVGGDVATAARRAVEGSVAAARDVGADVAELARSAAEGAIEAADRIGTAAGRAVRTTLSETASGVRELVNDVSAGSPPRSRAMPSRAPRTARRKPGARKATRSSRGGSSTAAAS
jgi:hypothetical protein